MHGYEYLKKFLSEEGYRITDENERHFIFKYQGTSVFAFKNESPYLQIVVMCNTSKYSRSKILEVCNEINFDKFIVKCMAGEQAAWVSYEFRPDQHTTNEEFDHIIRVLDNTSDLLFEKLSK